jgi:predicted CopG family antitoxin
MAWKKTPNYGTRKKFMKQEIQVVKKDGTRETYNPSKIKDFIDRACKGLGVNQLELESKVDIFLKDGIKTTEISDNIIQHAVQLASPYAPDWVYVAGRAYAMNEWAKYKLRDKSFSDIIHYLIQKKHYSASLLKSYSEEEINELGRYIKIERDLDHSHGSLVTAKKKYQNPLELNQHMHMGNAMRFGEHEPSETRIAFVKNSYDVLSNRETSLATPFMSNLRKGGNIASCFILALDDDIHSIFDGIKDISLISKNGGGIGIYMGYLRAKGSMVNGYKNAAGPITQWIRIINDTLVAVNQSFPGDTSIDTIDGATPIASVKEGSYVKTHDGTFREVIGVRVRLNDTPIFEVKTEKGAVRGTSGHPVLVVQKNGLGKEEIYRLVKNKSLKPQWIDISSLSDDFFVVSVK